MEVGAVIGAVPMENVRREVPKDGDVVILLGGRPAETDAEELPAPRSPIRSLPLRAAERKSRREMPPRSGRSSGCLETRKLPVLSNAAMISAPAGVSVAIGELAEGMEIDLNAVPKKYEGLDGTELAISESQERMAVVVDKNDAETFRSLAHAPPENLEATVVARVTKNPRLIMTWNGKKIVDISRAFLDTNGTEKHIEIELADPMPFAKEVGDGFAENYEKLAGDLNSCSRKGLSERFDSTVGAGTVLMPFGGKYQLTPIQAMVNKISVEKSDTDDCSLMAWGFNPMISEKSPYHGAYLAVVESFSKLIATGAEFSDVYLSFQEYFEKPGRDPKRWGKADERIPWGIRRPDGTRRRCDRREGFNEWFLRETRCPPQH